MTAGEQYRVLTPRERWQVTTDLIAEKTRPTSMIGQIGANGRIFLRAQGPKLLKRGDYWAEIAYNNWLTHPAVIFLHFMYCVVTCGLYSMYWFVQTFKKPPIWLFQVDQYGGWTSTQQEIPRGQKVIRYILVAWFAAWALFLIICLVVYKAHPELQDQNNWQR
jgi:hypothetical protein